MGRASVFSWSGAVHASTQVVGEETCLCGQKIPVRAEDYGTNVSCPSCGTKIQVGSTLNSSKYRLSQAAHRALAAASSRASAQAAGPPRFHRRVLIALVVLLAVTACVCLFRATLTGLAKHLGLAPKPDAATEADGAGQSAAEQRDRPTLTREMIGQIRQEGDPVVALIAARRWASWLHRDAEVAKDDLRLTELSALIAELEIRMAPPITLEMIEKLARSDKPDEGNIQAQMWQESLDDQKLPPNDVRLERLDEIVKQFQAALTKPKPPPAYVAQFNDLVQKLADFLKDKNLSEARKAADEADKLLQQHPYDLASVGRRLLTLKRRLVEQEGMVHGVRDIGDKLRQAEAALLAGKVTQGLELRGRARFLALCMPLTKEDRREFDAILTDLTPKIQFARGKRAIDNALACEQDRDSEGRDRQVERALAILPGLPESQIGPLLDKVRPWTQNGQPISTASGSLDHARPLLRSIERREAYERAWESCGNAQWDDMISACFQAEGLLGSDEESKRLHAAMGAIVLEVLETALGRIPPPTPSAEDQPQPIGQLNVVLRRWLDQLTPWRDDGRWKALDAAVRQQGEPVAQKALDHAIALAKKDRLAEALAKARVAQSLGNPASIRPKSESLAAEWQAEIKFRGDPHAEQAERDRLKALADRDEDPFAIWNELERFHRRFPKAGHAEEMQTLMVQTHARIETKCGDAIAEIEAWISQKQWSKARARMESLAAAPLPPETAAMRKRLEAQCEKAKEDAAFRLLALSTQTKKMLKEDEVLAVLQALPGIVEMDPDNQEAQKLLSDARRRGAVSAHQRLQSALFWERRNPALCVDRLRRAAALDPGGPDGRRAREILQE